MQSAGGRGRLPAILRRIVPPLSAVAARPFQRIPTSALPGPRRPLHAPAQALARTAGTADARGVFRLLLHLVSRPGGVRIRVPARRRCARYSGGMAGTALRVVRIPSNGVGKRRFAPSSAATGVTRRHADRKSSAPNLDFPCTTATPTLPCDPVARVSGTREGHSTAERPSAGAQFLTARLSLRPTHDHGSIVSRPLCHGGTPVRRGVTAGAPRRRTLHARERGESRVFARHPGGGGAPRATMDPSLTCSMDRVAPAPDADLATGKGREQ
jgi:hypothetical protein